MNSSIDVLCFSPHPDDAEFFCGGTLALLATKYSVALVDLTLGEMGSQGSVGIRKQEAEAAMKQLSLHARFNLQLPDSGIDPHSSPHDSGSQMQKVIEIIRHHRPKLILIPYWVDRHPDHSSASQLVTRAVYFAGLKQLNISGLPAHVPTQCIYYMLRTQSDPTFLVDVSKVYHKKLAAIACFKSQTVREGGSHSPGTLVSSPLAISSIEARDAFYGASIGCTQAEGFITKTAIAIDDPFAFFTTRPGSQSLFFTK